jgi:outer membrane protein OmpA-like peptidoglycan-associated protein
MGGHYTAGSIRVGAGVGPGLTRGLGEPTFRALASLDWVPPADADSDRDSIFNIVDACVTVPGVASADPKKHGCPSDRDNDTVLDIDDACPDVSGVKSAIPALHGCPNDEDISSITPVDRDRDTVLDADDKCPDVPGLARAPEHLTPAERVEWPAKYLGCPDQIDPGTCQIKLPGRIHFVSKSHELKTEGSEGRITTKVLESVLKVLQSNPTLKRIEIQGHASKDTYKLNQELSEKRAATVMTWLIKRGIEPGRLAWVGYGTDRPMEGAPPGEKELHQRVEFHLLECKKASVK